MTDRLVATIEQRRSGARVVKLAGVLDEHNDLGELVEKVGAGPALINLSGVERINSTGARDWVTWLASLESKGTKPMLIACSPAVVAQLNVIKNFAGNAPVKSFQVPYHCSICDRDKLLLVNVADMIGSPGRAPQCSCDACDGPMRHVDETGTYFAFLATLKPPKPETKHDATELARGSNSAVTSEHVKRISQPQFVARSSRPSLSAYQLPDGQRASEQDITFSRPRVMPANERPYLIAITLLLLCTVGVLVFLLLG
ncbi:MAG: hypothetical protein HOV81_29035 [Kofleriaceae bacterium]|nr:hypothetical protein [Kofleriaceae bacterium]